LTRLPTTQRSDPTAPPRPSTRPPTRPGFWAGGAVVVVVVAGGAGAGAGALVAGGAGAGAVDAGVRDPPDDEDPPDEEDPPEPDVELPELVPEPDVLPPESVPGVDPRELVPEPEPDEPPEEVPPESEPEVNPPVEPSPDVDPFDEPSPDVERSEGLPGAVLGVEPVPRRPFSVSSGRPPVVDVVVSPVPSASLSGAAAASPRFWWSLNRWSINSAPTTVLITSTPMAMPVMAGPISLSESRFHGLHSPARAMQKSWSRSTTPCQQNPTQSAYRRNVHVAVTLAWSLGKGDRGCRIWLVSA
jgi:hypothetical protein